MSFELEGVQHDDTAGSTPTIIGHGKTIMVNVDPEVVSLIVLVTTANYDRNTQTCTAETDTQSNARNSSSRTAS